MLTDSGKLGFIEEAATRLHDTVTALRNRAAKVEEGLQARAAGAGDIGAANPDLAAIQASIRSVMAYIRENPVPSALLALGAGVVATSMWNEHTERSGRRSRSR